MTIPSIPTAIIAPFLAATLLAAGSLTLPDLHEGLAGETVQLLAQAQGGSAVRRDDVQQQLRTRPVDCHRDVRTHRINGVMVRHRHVGDNCEVRVVRQSSEPGTGG